MVQTEPNVCKTQVKTHNHLVSTSHFHCMQKLFIFLCLGFIHMSVKGPKPSHISFFSSSFRSVTKKKKKLFFPFRRPFFSTFVLFWCLIYFRGKEKLRAPLPTPHTKEKEKIIPSVFKHTLHKQTVNRWLR